MPTKGQSPQGRRTRLSPQRENELYAVVIQLLREVGYDALRMPAVAASAKCSTATLYRQWQGKPGLVVAALRHHVPDPGLGRDIDTGTLRGDLRELACRTSRIAPAQHELMVGLGHAALRDPELAATMREQLSPPAVLDDILDRAVARGEIPADTPARTFCDLMMISVHLTRPIVDGRQADEDYLLRFVDAVMLPALERPATPES